MRPTPLDLDMYARDDFAMELPFYQADGVTPFALDGRVFTAEIRAPGSLTLVAPLAVTVIAGVEAVNNRVRLVLARAVVATLPMLPAETVWDLQQVYLDQHRTLFAGRVRVSPDVTA